MRNKPALFFLGLAILLGLAAAFSARRWLAERAPGPTAGEVPAVSVVITTVPVPIGAALTAKDLEVVPWPKHYVPKGAFSSIETAVGRITRRPVGTAEPVLEGTLLPDGSEAGLVSVIEENKRAVSVKVDAVIGVAGFVHPGSRVDVLATLRRIDWKKKLPYTKVVLQDVPVLAIDQKLEEAENGEPHLVSVVTLEVDPPQAEKLTYISHEGRLQLALRNPTDHEVVKTKSTGVGDVLPPRSVRRPRSTRVEVLKGTNMSTRDF
jgi:pilus assembly protein CpaB